MNYIVGFVIGYYLCKFIDKKISSFKFLKFKSSLKYLISEKIFKIKKQPYMPNDIDKNFWGGDFIENDKSKN
jgi:hypothetical protein